MQILIQNRKTGLFCESPGQWTRNLWKAHCFNSALEAYDFSQMHSLGETEIVVKRQTHTFEKILSYPPSNPNVG
jgi:hypothetical protein